MDLINKKPYTTMFHAIVDFKFVKIILYLVFYYTVIQKIWLQGGVRKPDGFLITSTVGVGRWYWKFYLSQTVWVLSVGNEGCFRCSVNIFWILSTWRVFLKKMFSKRYLKARVYMTPTIAAYFIERWDILTHLNWISVLTTQRSQLRSENVFFFVVWFIFISTFGPFYTDVDVRYIKRV